MSCARTRCALLCRTKKRCATRPPRPTGCSWFPRSSNNLGAMLNQLTISQLAACLAQGEVSARETMQACLDQIHKVEDQIHAFISYDAKDALAQADAADQARTKHSVDTP